MRIFQVRWWVPVSLTFLLAGGFLAIDYYNAQRTAGLAGSTGLGAVADPGIVFQPRHAWRRAPSIALPRQPLQFAPPMSALLTRNPLVDECSSGCVSGFVDTLADRLSTISIDVDTAAYTNIRRYLSEGRIPLAHEIRIEEMLNYFRYSYREPAGSDPFSAVTEVAVCPWAPEHRLLQVGLKSKAIETSNLPPSRLTFLVDVSGSMQSADKLPLVKKSLALLVEQLRTEDSVAIVVYAGNAGLVLPPTSGSQKLVIQDALDRLEAGGSTAGGAGIQLAYSTARTMFRSDANNRVILATDGDFNVGVSSDDELIKLIESEREHGVYLTVLGFGMGDLKDSKLEKLADHGNGHYAYVDTILEAHRVFVEQLGGTLQTVAKDVKFQVDFNPARVKSYRLIGYENRKLAPEDFRDDRKDAGDLGAGHSVTALYELVPHGTSPLPEDAFTLRLRYKPPQSNQSIELEIAGGAETSSPSPDFRFAAAVAQFGMLLRDSKDKGNSSFASTINLGKASAGGDARREEFLALVTKASEIRQEKEARLLPVKIPE